MATKRKKIVSRLLPETRSLRLLRAQGWVADMAEIRKGMFIKNDWGGFADLIAVRMVGFLHSMRAPEVLFVQATSRDNVRSRERKVLAAPDAYDCVWAGCSIQVWGWDKYREEPLVIDLSDFSRYEPLPYGHPDRP
tara:strand:+ start:3657 stop:4064 length:408 start_codon:yes stop_codon:yes gene_type:complete